MKIIRFASVLATVSLTLGDTINFDKETPGQVPFGFTVAVNKGFAPGKWVVEKDSIAPSAPNVLVQADPENTGSRFPVCVINGFEGADVDVSVRFKALKGKTDQAAGIIWRYRDPENYYVGVGPKAYGKNVTIPKERWSTLRVVVKADAFDVYVNGEKLFKVQDGTFKEAGKIGLWTKADSLTAFDDLTFSAPPKNE